MEKLQDAYDFIKHHTKRNIPVPEDVLHEAQEAEIEWLRLELASAFQEHIQPILDRIESNLTVICEHNTNEPAEIFISREPDIVSLLDDAVSLSKTIDEDSESGEEAIPQDIDDDDIIADETLITGKAKSIRFTVVFDDGYTISRSTAKDTMIETFRHMGFEKVAQFKNRTFKGFPLVGTRKRDDKSGNWQENVGNGWYVYTNMSNDTKKIMIQRVANALKIRLSIFDNIDAGINTVTTHKARKPRAVFSFNDRPPLDKRNSVLAVVKTYLHMHPNYTYKQILQTFPDHLQGSYGVVRTVEEIEARKSRGQQVEIRYFLDPHDILIGSDGVAFAVCNQWGDQFHQFQQHVKKLGWTLSEV